jgi:hypothetical protein
MRDSVSVDPSRLLYGRLLSVCPVPGCSMVTMGGTCVAHDPPVKRVFPRGRPFVAVSGDAVPPSFAAR